MKKILAVTLTLVLALSLFACAKKENRADTTLKEGEILLSGYASESFGKSLLIEKAEGYDWPIDSDRAYVSLGENIQFVVDGWYVTDLSADYFEDKYISVICSEEVAETYPVQLQNERMIIELK